MKNRVLIIGSDSVIGGYYANYLEEKNYNVAKFFLPPERYNEYGYDLFKELIQDEFDYIVNFLGLFSGNEKTMYHVNVELSVELMLAIKDVSPQSRFVLIGSAAEYGRNSDYKESGVFNPSSFYGVTKYLQFISFKKITDLYELDGIYARIFNVMSANINNNLFPGSFARNIIDYLNEEKETIELGNIDIVRDYLTLPKLAFLIESIMVKGERNEDYNVCSGYGVNIKSFVLGVLSRIGIDHNVIVLKNEDSAGNVTNDVIGNVDKLSEISDINQDNMLESLIDEYVEEIRKIAEIEL